MIILSANQIDLNAQSYLTADIEEALSLIKNTVVKAVFVDCDLDVVKVVSELRKVYNGVIIGLSDNENFPLPIGMDACICKSEINKSKIRMLETKNAYRNIKDTIIKLQEEVAKLPKIEG